SDSVAKSVKEFVPAVLEEDSVRFSAIVSYPLQRPYPLENIETPEKMKSYYPLIVDDSLRNIVKNAGPEKWKKEGWKGWSLDTGKYVWIDETVYDIPYLSANEKKERNRLIKEEMESIYPSMREGWTPEACMIQPEDSTVYRIDRSLKSDRNGEKEYRLAIYPHTVPLDSIPEATLTGNRIEEGTEMNIVYTFISPGMTVYYFPENDEMSADEGIVSITEKGNPEVTRPVKKTYWRKLDRRKMGNHKRNMR
ncbi:MAG: hypothetical protein K2N03_05075, partial [Muribaculaceae bacterium]|nr:hypothetical protein [Muribaculaceae bacterium]